MANCCICGNLVQDSDAILMINEKELPLCSECDEVLARMMEGSPDDVENASKEIVSRCIAGDANPAVKLPVFFYRIFRR